MKLAFDERLLIRWKYISMSGRRFLDPFVNVVPLPQHTFLDQLVQPTAKTLNRCTTHLMFQCFQAIVHLYMYNAQSLSLFCFLNTSDSPKLHCIKFKHTEQHFTFLNLASSSPGLMAHYIKRHSYHLAFFRRTLGTKLGGNRMNIV